MEYFLVQCFLERKNCEQRGLFSLFLLITHSSTPLVLFRLRFLMSDLVVINNIRKKFNDLVKSAQMPKCFYMFTYVSILLKGLVKQSQTWKMSPSTPWCKIFRVRVKLVTEHTVFWGKFNLLSQFWIFGGKRSNNCGEHYF